jgi:hypothetical protein
MKNGSQGPGIETIVNKEKIPHVPEKPSPIAFNCQGVISCKHLVQRIIQKSSLKIYLYQPIRIPGSVAARHHLIFELRASGQHHSEMMNE